LIRQNGCLVREASNGVRHPNPSHPHAFIGYRNEADETGAKAPSGGCVIRMQTENSMQSQKVMLVK
jgi:hypothetical protein